MNKSYKWVVKAGSSLVSGNQDGVNIDFISQLASQIDFLRKNNQEVIVISSGAVAKGMNDLGINKEARSASYFAGLCSCRAKRDFRNLSKYL